jgi:hypothetical protein
MERNDSSFRDPDGYIFVFEGEVYRVVNTSYRQNYDHLLSSGLYQKLAEKRLLIPFTEVDPTHFSLTEVYKVLKPERIPFISYPYEWSFNMLKDAALLTLKIQQIALAYGMSLKDASAFNVQFQNGKPVFIDTLSFELFSCKQPWIAYRQFCQHFLAPLALMANVDARLNRMLIIFLDGIPLDVTAKMLPVKNRFNLGLYLHIFLHAKSQNKHQNDYTRISDGKRKFSLKAMQALVEGLISTVENLSWKASGTEWADYTDEEVHKKEYTNLKTQVISELLDKAKPKTVWDFGANNGIYSRLASEKGIKVISFDLDPACVDLSYLLVKKNKAPNILPLFMDLLNVTPSIGWGGTERLSLYQRTRPDLIIALALIHHLAISANIPLESIASNFSRIADSLIIEFVSKEDEKVQLLLLNRQDIFPNYTQAHFEKIFLLYYRIEEILPSEYSSRTFYLMKKK